jgi:homoserine dehydrogenase
MRTIEIALLGFGNVGRSFVRYVQQARNQTSGINIRLIADSSGCVPVKSTEHLKLLLDHKDEGGTVAGLAENDVIPASEFIASLIDSSATALVESLPTNLTDGEPALSLISEALLQGVNVVTVDKGPLVHGYDALRRAAAEGKAHLRYSGTTGVSIPDSLHTSQVLEIRGVLNGTTNYILSEMQEHGLPFDEALAQAQRDGIAEPDPSLDIEGWDTACKILILAKTLMGATAGLAEVSRIGIGEQTQSLIREARACGRVVRLIGRARIWQGRVRVSVAPKLLTPESPFFGVAGTSKAALFRSADGEILVNARSGRDAISRTILYDLMTLP